WPGRLTRPPPLSCPLVEPVLAVHRLAAVLDVPPISYDAAAAVHGGWMPCIRSRATGADPPVRAGQRRPAPSRGDRRACAASTGHSRYGRSGPPDAPESPVGKARRWRGPEGLTCRDACVDDVERDGLHRVSLGCPRGGAWTGVAGGRAVE